jgi:hypothetical protein
LRRGGAAGGVGCGGVGPGKVCRGVSLLTVMIEQNLDV